MVLARTILGQSMNMTYVLVAAWARRKYDMSGAGGDNGGISDARTVKVIPFYVYEA